MCGISAVLSLRAYPAQSNDEQSSCLNEQLSKSLDLIQHRGPDARGEWASDDGNVYLGHVRLSIVDLSPQANQPFHDSENDVHAIVNGELYNDEYYRKLLGSEYDFQSLSDCEIVLALYKHYGLSFLSHLRGEFALILWDSRRKIFIGARDRYGVKSLYYTVVNNRLLVATEMKCFLPFGWKPEWDVQSLRERGWMFGVGTMFNGVKSVAPGHYIISRSFKAIEDAAYWEIEYPEKRTPELRSEVEMIEGVRARLMEAIKVRLRADVPLGIYLSGGLDSSAVAGMVAHLVKEEGARLGNDDSHLLSRIKCFTVQFEKDSEEDESDIAQRTAEWLGVDFHPVSVNEDVIVSKFEDTVWHSEMPIPDTNGMGRLAMAEVAKSHGIKVILTGEGSDEHFGGYRDLLGDFLLENDPSWPSSPSKEEIAELANRLKLNLRTLAIPADEKGVPESTRRMLNNTSILNFIETLGRMPFAEWTDIHAVTSPYTAAAESLDGRVRDAMLNRWHPLHTAEYLFIKGCLCNLLLRYLGDNIDMVHNVETRPPFLDHHLTEYVNGLPPGLKIKISSPDGPVTEKFILREAVHPFVTEEIYTRQKKSYLGPTRFQENGPLHKLVLRLTSRENVDALGFVDWEETQEHVRKAFQDKISWSLRVALSVCQFVVLSQRFGVTRATP
ncbi:uncharacterized protein N7479_004765 [Penicillium vulpinum]|uniref:Glutamine amidotransferase type-2 domain-containing protein n=1 Tax=Penicillium vulpinum TaxID=29845 RepID=A0A1V6RS41_9EURO|nr:uncharacterized protein N7479_004765 [Penicillium vulpinum]KAJ5964889.1 hypothetical protein N7479_004765 [Penicillium vulpinum]OQE04585.1 hypothetical protein PENVUL_c031G02996 [Penicillium vulpinum]